MSDSGSGRDKYRSRPNRSRVRKLFRLEWDPIGGGVPEDEYDTFADKAYVMLMHEGRSSAEIADYLFGISSKHMGLGEDPSLRALANKTAEKLVALRPDFEAESREPF